MLTCSVLQQLDHAETVKQNSSTSVSQESRFWNSSISISENKIEKPFKVQMASYFKWLMKKKTIFQNIQLFWRWNSVFYFKIRNPK